jgi:hypothetical protein
MRNIVLFAILQCKSYQLLFSVKDASVIGGYRSVEALTFPYPITGDNGFSAAALSAIFRNLFRS